MSKQAIKSEDQVKGEKYVDDTLIKLKRLYDKDEVVAALYRRVSELKIEIGAITAYTHELEDQIKTLKKKLSRDIRISDEFEKERAKINKTKDRLKKELLEVTKSRNELLNQILKKDQT